MNWLNDILNWLDDLWNPPVSKIVKTFEKTSKKLDGASVRHKVASRKKQMLADQLVVQAERNAVEAKRASQISTKLKELVS